MNNIYAGFQVFTWLLWRDLSVLRKRIITSIIDSLIMPISFIVIGGYILPVLGMPYDYGSFMVIGSMMSMCYGCTAWLGAGPLVSDLDSDKSITYELTLPVPSWVILVKTACGFAINAMLLNMFTLVLGKLLLMGRFDLSNMHIGKFIVIYVSSNLMFGFFATALAFWVDNDFEFGRFWMRFGSQLMFFSGMQFSWAVLYKASAIFAYIDLLNPLVYAFEGTRAAVLGQSGNLDYWLCLAALWLWIGILGMIAHRLFRKKLDCV